MRVSKIELSLTPALYDYRGIREHHTVVAVDILRATTAICAAFQAGVEAIVPLNSLEGLDHYKALGFISAAERGGRKVKDAECGNSPTEYLTMDLRGKKMAYSTTNGTVCILRGSDAERTLVGAFANITALTHQLLIEPQDLVILCSGWKNDFSIEDTLFAGALCQRLIESGAYASSHDAVHMALDFWRMCDNRPYEYSMLHASHVQRLIGFGVQKDIEFAFQHDTCPLVPILREGILSITK